VNAAGATCSGRSAAVRRGRAGARDGPDRRGIELPDVGSGSCGASGRGVARTIAARRGVVTTRPGAGRPARAEPRLIPIRREAPRDRHSPPDELAEIGTSLEAPCAYGRSPVIGRSFDVPLVPGRRPGSVPRAAVSAMCTWVSMKLPGMTPPRHNQSAAMWDGPRHCPPFPELAGSWPRPDRRRRRRVPNRPTRRQRRSLS
jgi:hypothetical protein